jgi:phage terminase Nu1 subunit (DNA packaging protein)
VVAVAGKGHTYGPKQKGSPEADAQRSYEQERAAHETVKREEREFKLAIMRGEYLPREAQRQAAATLVAVLTQGLRSIPDNIERKYAVTPEILDAITEQIDAGLLECANALRALSGETAGPGQ